MLAVAAAGALGGCDRDHRRIRYQDHRTTVSPYRAEPVVVVHRVRREPPIVVRSRRHHKPRPRPHDRRRD